MKFIILISSGMVSIAVTGQSNSFPRSWTGNWKGILNSPIINSYWMKRIN